MSTDAGDDNQIVVPPFFIALFVPPGRARPTESREHIAQRYELCEDMAQMLTQTARTRHLDLGITESDVLDRIRRGLVQAGSVPSPEEGHRAVRRWAELLGWPDPWPSSHGSTIEPSTISQTSSRIAGRCAAPQIPFDRSPRAQSARPGFAVRCGSDHGARDASPSDGPIQDRRARGRRPGSTTLPRRPQTRSAAPKRAVPPGRATSPSTRRASTPCAATNDLHRPGLNQPCRHRHAQPLQPRRRSTQPPRATPEIETLLQSTWSVPINVATSRS